MSQRIEKELGIPAQNLIMNPTHTHSASGGTAEQIFNVIKAAKEKLQPARIGYGTGVSYINIQRNIIDRKTNKWWEGANYDGPSDKTVAVIKFETTNGEPIAVYYNYACHAVVTGNTDMLSGDFPGGPHDISRTPLTTRSWRFFPPGRRATRIRSTSSRHLICVIYE